MTKKKVILRCLLCLGIALIFTLVSAYALLYTCINGPSPTFRNQLVLSAKQASATKWLPGLFLDNALVDEIVNASYEQTVQEVDTSAYATVSQSNQSDELTPADPWDGAIDGMLFETVNGPTFKAYVLRVKDSSRVFVGTAKNFTGAFDKGGERIYDAARRLGAIAAINGGEFPDDGGTGTGGRPVGLTYSNGVCVYNDGTKRTFIGIDVNNQLVVSETMTKAKADELQIRDAVSFQTNNVLIKQEDDGTVNAYYHDDNAGVAQRTAIGQTADGTMILIVTDGRMASSIGAVPDDIVELMLSYGAVNAAMLDGGSSAMMYYENYYEKYNIDQSTLDDLQKESFVVNKYKAFTNPRRMPTFFMVKPE